MVTTLELIMYKPVEGDPSREAPAPRLVHRGPVPRRGQPHDLLGPLPEPARPLAALPLRPQSRAKGDQHVGVYDVFLTLLRELGKVML